MDPSTVAGRDRRGATHAWRSNDDLEITLEANPGTVDAARFADIRGAGINRLSMGVQALNDADLKFLGRRHGVAEARTAWRAAAKIFPRVSFDLIYARPGQTVAAWEAGVERGAAHEVRDCGITHLSSSISSPWKRARPCTRPMRAATLFCPTRRPRHSFYERTQELQQAAQRLARL